MLSTTTANQRSITSTTSGVLQKSYRLTSNTARSRVESTRSLSRQAVKPSSSDLPLGITENATPERCHGSPVARAALP